MVFFLVGVMSRLPLSHTRVVDYLRFDKNYACSGEANFSGFRRKAPVFPLPPLAPSFASRKSSGCSLRALLFYVFLKGKKVAQVD